jgi:hypothetical protein
MNCLASINVNAMDPVSDAPAVAAGLRDAAALCREDQAGLAARLLIAAAVIDGLLARLKELPR